MKVIIYRFPILFLILYSFTYPIEISQDSVEQINFNEINPTLFIVNNSDNDINIDSMKIKLLSGRIFHEIYFELTVLDSTTDPNPEFVNIHSLLVKENDTTFNLVNYRSVGKENITLFIPSKKRIKIENLETGTKLGCQPTTNNAQALKKINEKPEFDYTVKLMFYQNGDISDYVIIKGYILINNSIVKNKTTIVNPVYNKQGTNINLLGRTIKRGSFLLCNNIVIFQNNEKKLLFNKLQ